MEKELPEIPHLHPKCGDASPVNSVPLQKVIIGIRKWPRNIKVAKKRIWNL